jgi:hypothetical protein
MATHLVSYDLRTPGKNYSGLHKFLKSFGNWAKPLESVWLIHSDTSSEQVRNAIRQHIDANDRLFVVNVTNREAAWVNLPNDVSEWMKSNL